MRLRAAVVAAALAGAAVRAQPGGVTFDRILHADREPHNWLTYSGSLDGHRHSLLTQITPGNAKDLELQWVFQTRTPAEPAEKFEATPLVVDGVMYTTLSPNHVVALDAATGRMFWMYSPRLSPLARVCCGRINRGLAILGDSLFMGTIDGHLIAMDAKTGREAWRCNTVPGPGDPGHETWPSGSDAWQHGGGSIWVTGSYDPALNLLYFGTGNPGPDWNADPRPGANLYTDSVVALDPDTGRLKWHYQFTPHDEFDYDSTQVPVLADIEWQGRPRKVMLWANRNGFWYVLDRATGEFLRGKPFVRVNWAEGIDEKGVPKRTLHATPEGTLVYPNNQGATNWYSPSYSPRTGLFYIPTWMDTSSTYTKGPVEYRAGNLYVGRFPTMQVPALRTGPGDVNQRLPEEAWGAIQAFDPKSGELKWQFKMTDVTDSGVLSTASDLVFAVGREGYFFALNARTGDLLWKSSVGGQVSAGPMSYSVGGRQYVAIAAGSSLFVYGLR